MPVRENASFVRPRLYDKDDPESDDDVALVLDGIESELNKAMASGDKEKVQHASTLKRRILNAADGYENRGSGDDDE